MILDTLINLDVSLIFVFFKTQYTASVGIQVFVPNKQQTTYPCGIIGNELISVPWECTVTVSHLVTHSASFPERGFQTLLLLTLMS